MIRATAILIAAVYGAAILVALTFGQQKPKPPCTPAQVLFGTKNHSDRCSNKHGSMRG